MPDLTALPGLPTLRASFDGEDIIPDRPGYTQAHGVLLGLAAVDHLSVVDDGTATIATGARLGAEADELILHQVPVLLGAGRPSFQALPQQVILQLLEATAAPGVTHLHHEVTR